MNKNHFRTGKTLEKWLDSEDSLEFRDSNFFDLFEIDQNEPCEVPYWLEQYAGDDNYRVEYIPGYYEPLRIGDIIQIDNEDYKYVDSVSLSEEMEHQVDNGDLVYEYRGSSFLRIWERIEHNE